jgi:hypothetical protein
MHHRFKAKRDRCRSFLLLAITIVVVSCGMRDETIEPESPSFGQPLVEPLPLRVGYAFDPTVDQEVLVPFGSNKAKPIGRYHLRLGPATRTAFELVFTAVFRDAVDLADKRPGDPSSTGLDGTIELRLELAGLERGLDGYDASTMFGVMFTNPEGTRGGVWRISGASRAANSGQRALELAIRAAAAEVAGHIGEQPSIRSWLAPPGSGHDESSSDRQ